MTKHDIFKYVLMGAASMLLMPSLVSCDKDDDDDADPVIRYVRTTLPAQSDSLLDAASLGSTIAFIGENLDNIKEVRFNDVKAFINTNFLRSDNLIIQVPNGIPQEITNKVYFTAKNGNVIEYPFTASIPAPVVSSVKSEMVVGGDKAYFYGNYFVDLPDAPLTVVFGDKEAEVDRTMSNNSQLVVTVPDGTPNTVVPVIRTAYGITTPTMCNNTIHEYVIDDFSNYNSPCALATDKNGNSYVHMEGSDVGRWSWKDPWLFVGEFKGDAMSEIPDGPNYFLKFEVRVNKPWVSGGLAICLRNKDDGPSGWAWEGTEGSGYAFGYYQPWVGNGSFTTDGEWITVKIPLSDFKYDKTFTETSYVTSPKDIHGIRAFLWGGHQDGEGVSGDIDIDLDNFRLYSE